MRTNTLSGYIPYKCLSLKSFPDKQTQLHYRAASKTYIFHQVDLYDVALLGADLQGKDLKEELDLGLVLLGEDVPPAANAQKTSRLRARIEASRDEGPHLRLLPATQ